MADWIKGSPPRGVYKFWAYSPGDGVYVGGKGLGSDDWLTSEGRAWQAPTHWQHFIVPAPPNGGDNG